MITDNKADKTPAKRLYQELALNIEQDFTRDEMLSVGSKLPSERELAEKYSVSRTTLREALIMLELKGLIEVRKGSGIYYVDQPAILLQSQQQSIGPFELLQARQWLESSIAELAASNISTFQLRKLREMTLDGPVDYLGDRDFHLLIAEGTHNNMMIKIALDLWNAREVGGMWVRLLSRITNLEDEQKNWHEDHLKIMHALMRRSPEQAKQAMWDHMENVKNTLFKSSDVGDPDFDGFVFN
ncbi:GntR family transcriptional regulator [Pseudovibrio sp. Tun.PSC04-5.I4]|uniref:GntR family transcriptional regulator n=1 Tax=Pseudovibrio sp. Tun.PSC04-5.I4 TaxID=1798213 RepID=UPI0008878265|nr:GntR family transcriptional regulator [Pseudovibrio sp. Tun.PSC04-5.I4]SDR48530.1 transcriptional regulator, GntR family [Pseudovibrio sp. Tun.PSC04-5.I4]